jgi:small subunit ribosomal protein S1
VDKVERRIGLSVKAVAYNDDQVKREATAFDSLRPTTDLVGLEQAAIIASEEWRPGQGS